MTSRSGLSACIITYNEADRIEACLQSVSFCDEIIVVDDASTDGSLERIKAFQDSRIRVLRRTDPMQRGLPATRNFEIRSATSRWIALLDADDYWLPSKLSKVVDAFQNSEGVGLVYHRFQEFRMESYEWSLGEFNTVSGFVPADIKSILLYTAWQTSGLTFRAELVRKLLPVRMTLVRFWPCAPELGLTELNTGGG